MKVEVGLGIDKIFAEPALLYNTGLRLEKQGYIGDLENKLAVYLAGTTKDYSKDDRISIIAKAQSGAGKSTVGNILERYFEDVYAFHRMTAHAADYWADEIETLDGNDWSIPNELAGSKSSSSLTICSHNELLYLTYVSQGQIYYQTFDGENWSSPPIVIPEFSNLLASFILVAALTYVILVTKRTSEKRTRKQTIV